MEAKSWAYFGQEEGVVHLVHMGGVMDSSKETLTVYHIHAGRPENVVKAHKILE